MISPKEYLKKEAKNINSAFLDISFDDNELNELFRYSIETGRRLRGTLLLISCHAVGGNTKKAISAATAVELMHKSSLIHDDIIDEGEYRRNKKTFNAEFGEEKAIIMGDLLCSIAFDNIKNLKSTLSNSELSYCYSLLANAYGYLNVGQYLDIALEGGFGSNERKFLDMIKLKSGKLIECSAMLGAILGGGTKLEIESLASYALHLAVGFQIQNDINNIMGYEKKLGIDQAKDIYLGKCSIPLLHFIDNISENEKARILSILSSDKPDEPEVKDILNSLQSHGSVIYAHKLADETLKAARDSLDGLRDSKTKEFLLNLAVLDTSKWYW